MVQIEFIQLKKYIKRFFYVDDITNKHTDLIKQLASCSKWYRNLLTISYFEQIFHVAIAETGGNKDYYEKALLTHQKTLRII